MYSLLNKNENNLLAEFLTKLILLNITMRSPLYILNYKHFLVIKGFQNNVHVRFNEERLVFSLL